MGIGPRYPRSLVLPCAEEAARVLSRFTPSLTLCGSLRRGDEDVGDIDVVMAGTSPGFCLDDVIQKELGGKLTNPQSPGLRRCYEIPFSHGPMKLDVWIVQPEKLGAALCHCTGPGLFNTVMRRYARFKGMKLVCRGLFGPNGEELPSTTEEECFAALGLRYLTPPERSWWPIHLEKELDEMEIASFT